MPDTATIDPTDDALAWAHVRRVVEASGSSFLAGMRILPERRRNAMYAIYAFCREVDDIADEPAPLAEKAARLDAWRAEIAGLYEGDPLHEPTAVALRGPVAEFGLAKEDFLALIEGMEMDANGPIRAPSEAELERYCDRVACAVGRLSVKAFGTDGPEAERIAYELGQALQLTNILRDLDEDAADGRLYLPTELLDRHGIAEREPAAVLAHPALDAVCAELAQRARTRFEAARSAIARSERGPLRPAIVMMEVYRRVLDALVARGWTRRHEVGPGKLTKLWIAVRYGLL